MTTFRRPGQGYPAPRITEEALRAIKVPSGPAPGATARPPMLSTLSAHQRRLAENLTEMSEVLVQMSEVLANVEHQRDLATDQRNDARRVLENARVEAERIWRFTREHPGHEFDLMPLLDALQIATQEMP